MSGRGSAGLPDYTSVPQSGTPILQAGFMVYTTTGSTPTTGQNGLGVINMGNVNFITNGGIALVNSDLYGLQIIL